MEVTEGLRKWAVLGDGFLSPVGETMSSSLSSKMVSGGSSIVGGSRPLRMDSGYLLQGFQYCNIEGCRPYMWCVVMGFLWVFAVSTNGMVDGCIPMKSLGRRKFFCVDMEALRHSVRD